VTGGTCSYCEGLAAEGAKPDQDWHNDCECTAEPAFNDDSGPSPSIDSDISTAAEDVASDVADMQDLSPAEAFTDDVKTAWKTTAQEIRDEFPPNADVPKPNLSKMWTKLTKQYVKGDKLSLGEPHGDLSEDAAEKAAQFFKDAGIKAPGGTTKTAVKDAIKEVSKPADVKPDFADFKSLSNSLGDKDLNAKQLRDLIKEQAKPGSEMSKLSDDELKELSKQAKKSLYTDRHAGDIQALTNEERSRRNIEAAEKAAEEAKVDSELLTPDDIGPLGKLIEPVPQGVNQEKLQEVLKALKALPLDQQDLMIDRQAISSIKISKGFVKVKDADNHGLQALGFYNTQTRELQIGTAEDAGNTALHEAMHAQDSMYRLSNNNPTWGGIVKDVHKEAAGKVGASPLANHYSTYMEGREIAFSEQYAELGQQYLQGQPYNLGTIKKPFNLSDDLSARIDAFFKKAGLSRVA
jgi:hypothetical protein